jgi:hypothetical protein
MNAGLPVWLQYVQAAAVIFIAGIGAWIAFRQMQIAATRLQHDLFDRRYKVFDAARRLLSDVLIDGDSSPESLSAFVIGVSDALFLFDDDLVAYLEEMRQHAANVRSILLAMEPLPPGEERAKASRVLGEHRLWLIDQQDGLAKKFASYLRIARQRTKPRRFSLLSK